MIRIIRIQRGPNARDPVAGKPIDPVASDFFHLIQITRPCRPMGRDEPSPMSTIAEALGAVYYFGFEFEDGTKI